MKDNFSQQADLYALYRPQYPLALYDYLVKQVPGRQCAWDCATGNGQVAAGLAPYFDTIYATDISEKQIANAVKRDNIIYGTGQAEHPSFAAAAFDLVTVGQAIHWFDFDLFYKAVNRVLKDDGVLAVIGYGLLRITEGLDLVIHRFYHDIVGPYWDEERRYVDEYYRTIPFPFAETAVPAFEHSVAWSLEQLTGYLKTWSAVQHYMRERKEDPVSLIREELSLAWGNRQVHEVCFPVMLRLGRKP